MIGHDLHAEPREYSGRIVLDTATLRFDRGTGDARWIVASITPTPGTGEATFLGAVLQGGKIVDIATGREVAAQLGFQEVGSWVLVAALEGDVCRDRGAYDWGHPANEPLRLTRVPLYDVFSHRNRGRSAEAGGGIIVTRYDAAGEGRKPFCEVNMIPPAWQDTVQSSFDAYRRGEPPFAPTTSRDEALSALLALSPPSLPHAESPLTAVAAFGRIVQDGHDNRNELKQAILAANGYLRAVFAFLAVQHAPDDASAVGVLQAVMEDVDTMEGLRAIVAGIGTVSLFADPHRSALWGVARSLQAAARARLERIHAGGEVDPFLKRMLYP